MTQTLWTAQEAAKATGGTATGDWTATGVSIDTRTLQPGDLFVALRGPSFDGHRFAADALKKGACAVMIDHVPYDLPADATTLRVADTQQGLEALGSAGRARTRAKVLAITGSVGKTGTKEALRHALSQQGKTHASAASFNNHWGVPLSLALLPADADYAVFELGMNHAGEIALDDLLVEGREREADTAAGAVPDRVAVDGERLERDRPDVCPLQVRQCHQVRRGNAVWGEPEPAEVLLGR